MSVCSGLSGLMTGVYLSYLWSQSAITKHLLYFQALLTVPPLDLALSELMDSLLCECCGFLDSGHWVGIVAARSAADVAKHGKEITSVQSTPFCFVFFPECFINL